MYTTDLNTLTCFALQAACGCMLGQPGSLHDAFTVLSMICTDCAAVLVIAAERHWTLCPACGSWGSGLAYTIHGVAASTCRCTLLRMLTAHLIVSLGHSKLCR